MTNADFIEPDWIEWNGGECPVDPDTRVLVRLRDGWESKPATVSNRAGGWRWFHDPDNHDGKWDVIAYRIVENPK